jgi:hypothetical protein
LRFGLIGYLFCSRQTTNEWQLAHYLIRRFLIRITAGINSDAVEEYRRTKAEGDQLLEELRDLNVTLEV